MEVVALTEKMEIFKNIKIKTEEIFNHQGFRRYGANTGWLFTEQILRRIAGFLVGIWVARYLGPERYGIFSYTIAFVAIFGGIARLGLDGILVRDLVKEPEKRDIYLGTAFWLKFIGAFITLGIISIAILFTSNDATTNLYVFIIAAGIIFQSFEVIGFYFQSKVLSKFVSICKMTQLFLSSFLKIYFMLIRADLFWFVLVTLIDQITLSISLYTAYRYQKLGSFLKYFDWAIGKRLLSDSWSLCFASFFTLFFMNINRILLNKMVGDLSVGLFSVAVNLGSVWIFITVIITSSLSPAIISARENSKQLYEMRLLYLNRLLLLIAVTLSLGIFILSNFLITKLYGIEYIGAIPILKVYIWSNVFVFLGNASWQWYIIENKQHLAIPRLLIGVILSVVLGTIFIKYFGAVGAAYSTLLSYFFAFYLGNIILKKTRHLFSIQTKAILSFLNYKSYFKLLGAIRRRNI